MDNVVELGGGEGYVGCAHALPPFLVTLCSPPSPLDVELKGEVTRLNSFELEKTGL